MENWIVAEDGSESLAPFDAPENTNLFDIYFFPSGSGYEQFLLANRIWIAKGSSHTFKVQWAKFDGTSQGRFKILQMYGFTSLPANRAGLQTFD